MHRDHGTEYGYAACVLRPADPRWATRPEEAMMALVLDDSVPGPTGTIQYPAAFGI